MLFNSYEFIFLYLPIVFSVSFWLARYNHRLATLWLGFASLTFYAMWDARFVPLLLGSAVFNYGAGVWISAAKAPGSRRIFLTLAIVINLTVLGYFKYTNFLVASINQFLGGRLPSLEIVLPLGISFFTFTQLAFLVDIYRNPDSRYKFIDYLLLVTYFPHVIAGPILHHQQMMPQFGNPNNYKINLENVSVGTTFFILGLVKKLILADTLAEYAIPIFNAARDGQILMLFEAWIGALAYTLQLYFDFSGYSDMAVGISLMFNLRLPLNFDSPYKATDIISFWRRWHMTLSAFLKDCVYIPMGGNRQGGLRRHANLMITMLIGGLWHGAGWTFIAWGGLHGLYLIVNHGWRGAKARLQWGPGGCFAKMLAGMLTFVAVVVAWVFFRADHFSAAATMLLGMAGNAGVSLPTAMEGHLTSMMAEMASDSRVRFLGLTPVTGVDSRAALLSITFGLAVIWLLPNLWQIFQCYNPTCTIPMSASPSTPANGSSAIRLSWKLTTLPAIVAGTLLFACLLRMASGKTSEFLYFQF